ncbi:DUF6339 family protein [Streptomyces sp. HB2AG]|uniref:DUF6339 family protein n=1 Tax=Streptomyces sp. HB2AG TaxID=2983400 RepID=UPI0022AB1C38|nr:DUF6339 family protein [Streptomyces sp. HB2AG]MCZ2523855.1 DUF6339 family protein [Streptomyces sp. HB2AG]
MGRHTDEIPEHLAVLPDAAVRKHLTRSVLTGRERPPLNALTKAAAPVPAPGVRWETAPVRDLLEQAMHRYGSVSVAQADAWLAPRLHATLRMTRSEAADSGVWNFLATVVGHDYVWWRHRGKGKDGVESVAASRYCGPSYTQTFSRLWWAAELFRNGDDYRPVRTACGNQDMLNTGLRLSVLEHRPTAQAVIRLLEKETVRTGREVNALLTIINIVGATTVYDVLALDETADADELERWIAEADDAPPVSRDRLPDGPPDGAVPPESIDTLVPLFEKLFAEAEAEGMIRGRTVTETEAQE